jgi:hypothetical protein
MQHGWHSLSALRSDSRECPRSIGVGNEGGERSFKRRSCTSDSVVFTGARASAVMPDQLENKSDT